MFTTFADPPSMTFHMFTNKKKVLKKEFLERLYFSDFFN